VSWAILDLILDLLIIALVIAALLRTKKQPVLHRVTLYCPFCLTKHVDEGQWATKPHHTHLCSSCGQEWRVEPYCVGA